MRLNIFRNPIIDVQVAMLMDNYDHAIRKQTEDYWRRTIANEIYDSCEVTKIKGYPCADCFGIYFKIRGGTK